MLFLVLAATLSAEPTPDPFLSAWKPPAPVVQKADPFADVWSGKPKQETVKKTIREIVPSATEHTHSCPNCKYKWSHDDSNKGNVATHTCPQCGTLVFDVYKRNAEIRERVVEQKVSSEPAAPSPATQKTVPSVSMVPNLDVFNTVPQNCPT